MDDSQDDFQRAMKGVRQLKPSTTRRTRKAPSAPNAKTKRYFAASPHFQKGLIGDHKEAEVPLYWFQKWVPKPAIRKLQSGEVSPDLRLDLHGLSIDESAALMERLISEALQDQIQVVQAIHGKGFSGDKTSPLKGWLDHWLYQHESVEGYCSCPEHKGGTGATYILIQLSGRE